MDFLYNDNGRELKLSFDASGISRNNLPGPCMTTTGEIGYFATIEPPKGWLLCDGSSFDETIYSDLAIAINAKYGVDSNGKMKLPDLRGQFIRCYDSTDTRAIGSYEPDKIKQHNHLISGGSHKHTLTHEERDGIHNHTMQVKQTLNPSSGTDEMYTNTSSWQNGGVPPLNQLDQNDDDWAFARGGEDAEDNGTIDHTIDSSGSSHTHDLSFASQQLVFNQDNTGIIETRPINCAILVCIKY